MPWRSTISRALVALGLSGAAGAGLHAQLPAPPAGSNARIHVGGYAGLVLQRPDTAPRGTRIVEANAALLLSGTLASRLTYFGELDAVSSSRENLAGRQDDRHLDFARLYLEYTHRDALRLRVGRFLTPIGQWNEAHAEPLTLTSVRPLASYRSFAKYATGALLAGQLSVGGHDAGYAVFVAPFDAGGQPGRETEFAGAAGGRVAVELAHGIWLGASAALVRERRPASTADHEAGGEGDGEVAAAPAALSAPLDWDENEVRHRRTLTGLDLRANLGVAELRAEATWLSRGEQFGSEQAAFAQLAVPVWRGLTAVGRAERVSPLGGQAAEVGLLGAAWRLPRGAVLKLERQSVRRPTPFVARGWFVSLSALF